MPIRIYKPTSPGRRNASVNIRTEVTKHSPEKSLLRPIKKTGGRNHTGKITVRSRRPAGGTTPARSPSSTAAADTNAVTA